METISQRKETKSAKNHCCDLCGGDIYRNEFHLKSTHVMDGRIYSWRMHAYCEALCGRLNLYGAAEDAGEDGVSGEFFREAIDEEYLNISDAESLPKAFIDRLVYVLDHHGLNPLNPAAPGNARDKSCSTQ